MQNLMEEIKMSPGVMGACVYTNDNGIIASNLPGIFKPETQEKIGSTLQRIFKLNETVKLDVNSLEIQYDEALILVKQLCAKAALILICEPEANLHLINMSTSVMAEDLKQQVAACAGTAQQAAAPTAAPATAPAEPEDPKEVLNGPLAQEFATIKNALAMHIGPVAGKMLEKHLKTWLQQGASGKARLKDLLVLLAAEIDSAEEKQQFLSEAEKAL
ncbi:MAG: hypothetical protein C0622_05100 [Desulfuromonas sp.]|nr:MAG: hypothetical protein C0622_05100 [Desulfuromonas sp.]